MEAYVRELIASRQCVGDERKVIWVGDSGQPGTDVYWCEHASKWLFIELDNFSVKCADEIALVRLEEDYLGDPEELNQSKLAWDWEGEKGMWLVDANDLPMLSGYGAALELVWQSGAVTDTPAVVDGADSA